MVLTRSRNQGEENFGQQAAKFSLYVPVAVLLIGCLMRGGAASEGGGAAAADRSARIALAWLNLALIVSGFVLGVIALASMKKFGTTGILGRALTGVALNGLALSLLAVTFLPLVAAATVKQQVVGTWRVTTVKDPNVKQADITLNEDGTFRLVKAHQTGQTITLTGTWVLTPKKLIGLMCESIDGGESAMMGKRVGLGIVKHVDDGQMTLSTDSGDESYQRVP